MTPPRAGLRLACALGVALIAVTLAGAPAFATAAVTADGTLSVPSAPTTPPTTAPTIPSAGLDAVTPLVDCVQDAPLGAVTSRTVVLGYRSTATAPVTAAAGSGSDTLSPGAADRGQPTVFQPGDHHAVWLLTVDAATEPAVTWTVGPRTATIDASAPACTDATAVALSVPTSASATAPSTGIGTAPSTSTSTSTSTASSTTATVPVSATVTRFLLGPPDAGSIVFAVDGVAAVTAPIAAGGIARADLPTPAVGAHTVTATFTPAAGSTLRPATASAPLAVTAASGPLSVVADSVVSGSTTVRILVTRTAASGAVGTDFATLDGSARAGSDYVATSGTVTLADGQSAATASIGLPARAPGSPAAVFFVVLKRASTSVDSAVTAISLPAVPAAPGAAVAVGTATGGGGSDGPASALPQGDPTAHLPVATAPVGQDLLVLLGAGLVTFGGVAGVVGLVRSTRAGDALP